MVSKQVLVATMLVRSYHENGLFSEETQLRVRLWSLITGYEAPPVYTP
jgi:hypothetical protein